MFLDRPLAHMDHSIRLSSEVETASVSGSYNDLLTPQG